jgi:hypothetical protein
VFPTVISVAIAPNPTVTSLTVVGLNAPNGKKATIRRGAQALALVPAATLPSLTIENLRFEQPAFTAVSVLRANGSVRISGIHVAGVLGYFFTPFNAVFREGIAVTSLGPVTGEVVISDNVIDGGTYSASDTTLAVSGGIVVTGAVNGNTNQPLLARVRMSDNKIVNWSGSGILAAGLREATVERNRIEPGTFANLTAGCTSTNNMGAANGMSLANVADSTIRDNVVTLVPALTGSGTAPACTSGIVLAGPDPGGASGNLFYRNRVRGTGTYGLIVGAPSLSAETDNLFALNPLGNFAPQNAALLIGPGANGNDFVGNFSSIAGNAAGNVIISR